MPRSLALLGMLALWAAPVPLGQEPAAPVVREENVMMPARDGIRLATDIYRPAGDGGARFPVLLHRTPYDKSSPNLVRVAEYFARHGYVVVVEDTRGRHRSEGVFSKYYKFDALDGYDAVEWAARLPYSNGKVGMWGTSYAAHTQADASKMNPPSLKTLVLNMGGMANAWDHAVRHDGAFELGRQLTWAWQEIARDARDPVVREMMTREKVSDWYAALPLRKGLSPLAVAPNYEAYFLEEATRADYDEHWKGIGLNWEEYYEQTADAAMLHISGWYDSYLRGTVQNYLRLSALKKSPMRLLVGPWTHGGNARSYAGEVEFGPEAAVPDFDTAFHLRWFDHYLKGLPSGAEKDAPIRLFVMGTGDGHRDASGRLLHGGYWRQERQWPLPDTRSTRYYFHADGSLSVHAPGKESESTTYTFDPRHPVPTIGGGVSPRLGDGAFDQRERENLPRHGGPPYLPLRSRSDIVVFQTEPLSEDVQVIGPVEVKLFAASTGVDTDFTAKLVDVYPPSADFPRGFDLNLADGIIRARYRDNLKTQKLMTPGTVYEFTIRPFPTANVFKRGHRIRVDISSSNFPMFDVNPNTGEPLGQNRRMRAVENSIFHSAARPSHLVLPVVPVAR